MPKSIFRLLTAILWVPCFALAAEQQSASPGLFTGAYVAQVLGSLLLVFGCLFGVIFLLRKFHGVSFQQNMPVRVLNSLRIGTREKLLLVEVGGEQLLIGVTPGSIRTLHKCSESAESASPAESEKKDFQSYMADSSAEQTP